MPLANKILRPAVMLAPRKRAKCEQRFLLRWTGPKPYTEVRFHQMRQFRFDFCWPDDKVALEIEGGLWRRKGAHNTGKAIARDIEKYNLATACGWRVFRLSDANDVDMVVSQLGLAIKHTLTTTKVLHV